MNLLADPAYRCGAWEVLVNVEEDPHTCHLHLAHHGPHECDCGHSWPRMDVHGFLEATAENIPELD